MRSFTDGKSIRQRKRFNPPAAGVESAANPNPTLLQERIP
jgi:hypothetical protein